MGGLEGMLGALGGLDMNTLSAAAGLIGQFADGGDDKRTALLNALRPFVREERDMICAMAWGLPRIFPSFSSSSLMASPPGRHV